MVEAFESTDAAFVERRRSAIDGAVRERRQFGNSYHELSPAAQDLGRAIDAYKLAHRRRYITYEEMLTIVQSLGYHREP